MIYLPLTSNKNTRAGIPSDHMLNEDSISFSSQSDLNKIGPSIVYRLLIKRLDLNPSDFSRILKRETIEKILWIRDINSKMYSSMFLNREIYGDYTKICGILKIYLNKDIKVFNINENIKTPKDIDCVCSMAVNKLISKLDLRVIDQLKLGYYSHKHEIYSANTVLNFNYTDVSLKRNEDFNLIKLELLYNKNILPGKNVRL